MKLVDVKKDVNGYFPMCGNCRKYYPDIEKMVLYDSDLYICFDCVEEMYELFIGNMSSDDWAEYVKKEMDKLDWSINE